LQKRHRFHSITCQQQIDLPANSVCRFFNLSPLLGMLLSLRVKNYSDYFDPRNKRAQQAQPLAFN